MRTNRGSSLHWGKGGGEDILLHEVPYPLGITYPSRYLPPGHPIPWVYPTSLPPKGPGTRDTLLSPGKDIEPVTREELGTRDTPTPSPPPTPSLPWTDRRLWNQTSIAVRNKAINLWQVNRG